MNLLAEYGLFLAKTVTFIAAFVVLLSVIINTSQRMRKQDKQGYIEVSSLNDKFRDMSDTIRASILPEAAYLEACKQEKKAQKAKDKQLEKQLKQARKQGDATGQGDSGQDRQANIYVIDFIGDIRASACEALTEQVTAVLTQATADDEVVVRLESAGGMVHAYGLAASQLQRIRDKGIALTVCVDKVAASGGYMMACIGHKLIAAPFAVLGSIGVVAQMPNLHRLLKKHDVDYEMLTAGEYKRTLTVFGENTDKARQKFQEELEDTHRLFKAFVSGNRPQLDIDKVATGEVWYGQQALAIHMADAVQTSDDYLYQRYLENAELYQIRWVEKHTLAERLGLVAESTLDRVALRWLERLAARHEFLR